MFKDPEDKEKLKIPSQLFKSTAVETVASSFLFHRRSEEQYEFRRQLAEALDDPDQSPAVIVGLREAGLRSITIEGKSRIFIRGLNLANPDPEEFSSKVIGALSKTSQDPVEVLTEQGKRLIDNPDSIEEVNEWIEGMEIAVRKVDSCVQEL